MKLFVSILLILFSVNSYSQDVQIAKHIEGSLMLFYNGKQTVGIGGVGSPFFPIISISILKSDLHYLEPYTRSLELTFMIYDYCKGGVALSFIHNKTALAFNIITLNGNDTKFIGIGYVFN